MILLTFFLFFGASVLSDEDISFVWVACMSETLSLTAKGLTNINKRETKVNYQIELKLSIHVYDYMSENLDIALQLELVPCCMYQTQLKYTLSA